MAGLARQASALVTIYDDSTISVSGTSDVYGIHASASDPASTDIKVGDNVSVDIAATNSIRTNPSAGLFAEGVGASIDVGSRLTVSADGDSAYGIYAADGGKITIGNSADITTSGSIANSVYALRDSTVDIGAGAAITTLGYAAYGASAYDYSTMNIGAGAAITTSGDGAFGAIAFGSSTIDIGEGAAINTTGAGALGASAYNSTIDIGGGAAINTTGQGAHAVYASDSTIASSITLNGGTFSATGTDACAILADGKSNVTGSGVFDITGNIRNDGSGLVALTMSGGSVLTGAVQTNAAGATNLAMASATTWLVSDDSDLGLGNLDNGGVVDFNANSAYMTVKAGTLGANGGTDGLFDIKMDVAAQASDKLEIADTADGSYTLTGQADDAALATTGQESFNVIEIGGVSTASFALAKEMELGAWMYSTRQIVLGASGTAVQVYSTGLSNAASAAVNTFASGYLMSYVETTTLIQRLGDLRDTTMQNGVWARVHGGKFNTDGMRCGKEFDLDYGGVQIGYDRKLTTAWDGSLYAGIMFGYAKGDIDFDYAGGGGDVKSKTLGVYGTYKQTDGLYVDAVLKYQWIDYDFHTYNSAGAKVTANDPDGGGFGLSLEAGKRFELKNNWFVEPQAQLSYQKQDGGTFYMSNGLRLGVDDWTSLLGRLGVRVGYESGTHSFYAKLSWVKEFDGDFDFTANGVGFRDSFDDNWWVYGIGCVSKINERNSLYLDLERSSGGVFEQDWAIKGGWRVEM